jgi:hypothetical protein
VNLLGTDPPSILGHPLSTVAEEGESTKFVCQFKGPDFPISRVQWLRNLVPIPIPKEANHPSTREEQAHHQRIRNHEHNATLAIKPVVLGDSASYVCEIITPGFPAVRSRPAQLIVTGMK